MSNFTDNNWLFKDLLSVVIHYSNKNDKRTLLINELPYPDDPMMDAPLNESGSELDYYELIYKGYSLIIYPDTLTTFKSGNNYYTLTCLEKTVISSNGGSYSKYWTCSILKTLEMPYDFREVGYEETILCNKLVGVYMSLVNDPGGMV